jgi:hypothetical protein
MPFSKYNIDPDRIEALWAAFNRVCEALLPKCDRDDPMIEVSKGINEAFESAKRAPR